MGRPSHRPDEITRRQVEALAGYGVPETDIAGLVGIDPKTMSKHYRHELDFGHTKANAKVAENLFRKATGDGREAVTAAIFWMKTRARWKETSVHEHALGQREPISEIRRIIVTPPERSASPAGDNGALHVHTGVMRPEDSSFVLWERP